MSSTNPGTLEDVDNIWGSKDDIPNREWSKMDEDFTNAGYREGITAGKESALQEGFDEGFAHVGAPLGREIGILRGAANATMSFLSSSSTSGEDGHMEYDVIQRRKEEIRSIVGRLGQIHLADIAPRDLEAEEHARAHLEAKGPGDVQVVLGDNTKPSGAVHLLVGDQEEPPAVDELNRLRMRLSNILLEIGLNIPLI